MWREYQKQIFFYSTTSSFFYSETTLHLLISIEIFLIVIIILLQFFFLFNIEFEEKRRKWCFSIWHEVIVSPSPPFQRFIFQFYRREIFFCMSSQVKVRQKISLLRLMMKNWVKKILTAVNYDKLSNLRFFIHKHP